MEFLSLRIDEETDTKRKVILIAIEAFQEYGYGGVSLKMIAKRAGISAPALYWHFASKEDLFAEALSSMLLELLNYVYSNTKSEDPETKLREFVRAHVYWQLTRQEISGAYAGLMSIETQLHKLSETHQHNLTQPQREYRDFLCDIIEAGAQQGRFQPTNIKMTAYAILAMCDRVHSWYKHGGELSVEDVCDAYEEYALKLCYKFMSDDASNDLENDALVSKK